ncbi:glycosyltransferase family 4 protein [Flavobacterium psychrolimnae]|uniref:Glycosyl transferase family 1 domain-containing protein n=1 Tax=Flavobacterium psychrolimnae TaxID=249351 RepID=A0A366AXA8_9FLAO|nr:glycosyltransferase family 4 protein [Flavobacterium psychrolimnae]RBN49502.1 hypothetical protein DR980_12480 [Flavobacterium psychrolimnae]
MVVIQCSQFSAPYKGAFIKSLERLEELNSENSKFVYVFPQKTKKTSWINQFMNDHEVYFTMDDFINGSDELLVIFNEVKPDIVHTHFDGYDIPVTFAKNGYLKKYGHDIKVIWHLHNKITFHSNNLKKIYQFIIFKYHYGYLARKVNIISVSDEMSKFVSRFGNRNNLKFITEVIFNGARQPNKIFRNARLKTDCVVFGTFGGRNIDKRIDVLLNAAQILSEKNLKFKVVITKGVDTVEVVKYFFRGNFPDWLELIDETDNVADFFNSINCYVSTSVHETFSFAILEATFYNIPVIQSNIPGTMWNADKPSTFVFESLNSKDLSIKMEEVILFTPNDLDELCLKTKEINLAIFDVDIWCSKVKDVYCKVLR